MFERLSRSWELVKASAKVLSSDRQLLIFPVMSLLASLVVLASFALPVFGLGLLPRDGGSSAALWGVGFLFYLSQYFVIFFFGSALVGAAMIRLDGGQPSVRDGLEIAWSKVGVILGYAAIAATVGVLLRALEERAGFVGRIVIGLLGAAWTVATFMTVPVLVAKDVGPIDAVKESMGLLRKTWGENLVGQGGIGLAFGLLSMVVFFVGVGLTLLASTVSGALAVTIAVAFVVAMLGLGVYQSALTGVYSAALYQYASSGESPAGFEGGLLRDAFQPK